MQGIQTNADNAGGLPPILFTSCELLDAAHEAGRMAAAGGAATSGGGATPAAKRREGTVGGRRVKTIDVHAHCVIPESLQIMGLKTETHERRGPGISEVGARRIAEMDAQGIDIEALSINPFWYRAEKDQAVEVVRIN